MRIVTKVSSEFPALQGYPGFTNDRMPWAPSGTSGPELVNGVLAICQLKTGDEGRRYMHEIVQIS